MRTARNCVLPSMWRFALVLGLASAANGLVVGPTGVHHGGSHRRVDVPSAMAADVDEVGALCAQLQSGDATAEALWPLVSKRASANRFFQQYLSGAEWTCADETEPPAPLLESLSQAPEAVLEVILMNIVQGAAAEKELQTARAIVLVNALWDKTPVIPQSCRGLREAVASQLGAELKMAEDASGGNEETIKMMWDNLLGFLKMEPEEFERARDALAKCGQ
jgi:hypothetical protein